MKVVAVSNAGPPERRELTKGRVYDGSFVMATTPSQYGANPYLRIVVFNDKGQFQTYDPTIFVPHFEFPSAF